MKKEKIKATILTTREILLYLVDFTITAPKAFDRYGLYRKTVKDYEEWRYYDRRKFQEKLAYLKTKKIITSYEENKNKYIELTPRGIKKVQKLFLSAIEIERPKYWDNKWRIIVFDIPDDKRDKSNIFREHLKRMGFFQFQRSIYIYPFECKQEIGYIARNIYLDHYIKYIVADFFDGDKDLIRYFKKEKIITEEMFESKIKEKQ